MLQNLYPELTRDISDVKTQNGTFDYFYGVNVLQLLLRHSDILSRTLQSL